MNENEIRPSHELGVGLEATISELPADALDGVRDVFKKMKNLGGEK